MFSDKKLEILLHYSGSDLCNYLTKYPETQDAIRSHLRGSDITQIEIHTPSELKRVIEIKPLEAGAPVKKIIIFTGFFLDNDAYQALYSVSKIAGVSGDNSLELAISTETLPFYRSTNRTLKMATLERLNQITQLENLQISPAARESFKWFFDNEINLEMELDFSAMLADWPIVCAELVKHHNFYDQLDQFILTSLPIESCPVAYQADPMLIRYISDNPDSLRTLINTYSHETLMEVFNKKDALGKTALHYVAREPNALKIILGQYPNQEQRVAALNELDIYGNSAIHCVQNNATP